MKKVGRFNVAGLLVDVWFAPDFEGGAISYDLETPRPAQMTIGAAGDPSDVPFVAGALGHEIAELVANVKGYSFDEVGALAQDAGQRVFVMNHTQFSELCSLAFDAFLRIWSSLKGFCSGGKP